MEKIYLHIEKLLALNDYVVVPGLGGFVLQYESAKITDNIIQAPRKVIAFNPLMCHSDGLLEIEISRSEHLSYRKAQEVLSAAVDKFKLELQLNKLASFGNFGSCYFSEEDGMSFYPAQNASFIPSNIGLKNILLTDLTAQPFEINTTARKSISIRKVMRYAAVITLLLSTMFISEKVNYNTRSQSAAILNLSKFQTAKPLIADTATKPCAELKQTIVSETLTQNNDSDLYHVIVASLPSQQSADDYCKQLVNKSFECAHVLKPIRTYRVAIKSFADKTEAIAYMEQLRLSDKQFESAWVLCK